MAFVFISGKNNGYPCFASLPDIYSAKCTSSPYPKSVFTLPLSGGSYPQKKVLGYNFPTSVTSSPYPVSVFRCLGELYNNGYPVKLNTPGIESLNIYAQSHNDYIRVYNSRNNNYDSNGYAILRPLSCTINQEKNGMYEAEIELNADETSKYIKCNKILNIPIKYHDKIIYQLFRIYHTSRKMDNNGNLRIVANARHIFYDLNDYILDDVRPTELSANSAIDYIMANIYNGVKDDYLHSSDLAVTSTAYYQGVSVTSALIGEDNSIINRWGGCLYRDNYYFSINQETEHSKNTGTIRYGYNMVDIDFTTDYSDCITCLIADDNFGNHTQIKNSSVPNDKFPHHIYKSIKFSYDIQNKAQFLLDAKAYYDNYKQESVNIKVTFADLSNLKLYSQFLQLADYEVGDKVTVYHNDLDINYGNLEIISKKYDVVNKKTLEIEIGSFKNATERGKFLENTANSGITATDKQIFATQSSQAETNLKFLKSWDLATSSTWNEANNYTWNEVTNIGN